MPITMSKEQKPSEGWSALLSTLLEKKTNNQPSNQTNKQKAKRESFAVPAQMHNYCSVAHPDQMKAHKLGC